MTLKNAGYLQLKGAPMGPMSSQSSCHLGQNLNLPTYPMLWILISCSLDKDLGWMPHSPWETCFCSDWHVVARCPGLWTLSWLYSSRWGWHVPCQHPRHLRPCCHRGRKSSWKANRNLGKKKSSSQRDEDGRRNCPSKCGQVAHSPRQHLRHFLP